MRVVQVIDGTCFFIPSITKSFFPFTFEPASNIGRLDTYLVAALQLVGLYHSPLLPIYFTSFKFPTLLSKSCIYCSSARPFITTFQFAVIRLRSTLDWISLISAFSLTLTSLFFFFFYPGQKRNILF